MTKILYAGTFWDRALERLGRSRELDSAVGVVERVANRVPESGNVKDLLSGTWLGHALHPMLTDLPIGFWTSAFMFDLMGEKYDDAARRLVAFGILSAVPTAMTGAADWNDTSDAPRRVGAVHAIANSTALVLYIGSWAARRRGRRAAGIGLGMAGATMATVGGFLGGHLVSALGTGVDHTAFETDTTEWTRCCPVSELSTLPTRVQLSPDTAVLVVRRGDQIAAVNATCPHRGAPLDEGRVEGDVVVCPWHGSRFSLVDGSLRAGPSPAPLRCYDVRVREGAVEVRQLTPGNSEAAENQ